MSSETVSQLIAGGEAYTVEFGQRRSARYVLPADAGDP